MLRPDLRPSLSSKEFHKFYCWHFAETARWTDPRTNGMPVQKINTLPITELIPGIEAEIEVKVLEQELLLKKNGFKPPLTPSASIFAEYNKWRKLETSRRRAEAAREKARKCAKAKADAEKAKCESKLARRKRPHFTGLIDVEKELDSQSLQNYLAQ